ncbi:FxLYD domain-containing protein [Anaerococcus ihuae]|uniref:FxLYD domain-containing protein n=1 Tax=Anaerococcus ihuae TaxID=2899519 RepID=UPI001F228B4C|nr:FxLYD domain-containing protein [Anaerococcus ihuae]
MKLKKIILCALAMSVFVGCGDKTKDVIEEAVNETKQEEITSNSAEKNNKKTSKENSDYEVTDVAIETDEFGISYVTGILKNNTDKPKSYIQILFPVKDSQGNKIGDAIDNVNNIEPNGTWKFKATSLENEEGMQIDTENYDVTGF